MIVMRVIGVLLMLIGAYFIAGIVLVVTSEGYGLRSALSPGANARYLVVGLIALFALIVGAVLTFRRRRNAGPTKPA